MKKVKKKRITARPPMMTEPKSLQEKKLREMNFINEGFVEPLTVRNEEESVFGAKDLNEEIERLKNTNDITETAIMLDADDDDPSYGMPSESRFGQTYIRKRQNRRSANGYDGNVGGSNIGIGESNMNGGIGNGEADISGVRNGEQFLKTENGDIIRVTNGSIARNSKNLGEVAERGVKNGSGTTENKGNGAFAGGSGLGIGVGNISRDDGVNALSGNINGGSIEAGENGGLGSISRGFSGGNSGGGANGFGGGNSGGANGFGGSNGGGSDGLGGNGGFGAGGGVGSGGFDSVSSSGQKSLTATLAESEQFPWNKEGVRDDVYKVFNVRLTEPMFLKLKYVAQQMGKSTNSICIELIGRFLDEKLSGR